jgi:thiol-disulfide isomerase/thioredoxin
LPFINDRCSLAISSVSFMQIIEASAEEFDLKLKESQEKSELVLVHVYASTDPQTGKSWCPDCVKAFPNVEKLAASREGILLNCPAGG